MYWFEMMPWDARGPLERDGGFGLSKSGARGGEDGDSKGKMRSSYMEPLSNN